MIRKYRSADVSDLVDAWYSASIVSHPFLHQEFFDHERKNIVDLHLPKAETWVFESEGTVVGFIALLGNEIGGLFVHSNYQRKGIGKALVDHVFKTRNFLEVNVFKENVIGCAFYKEHGFTYVREEIEGNTGHPQLRLKLDR